MTNLLTHDAFSEYPPRQLALCKNLTRIFASITFAIGFAALLGWILDVEVLKRIHPALVTMKANTSVCLMLVATSVLLLQDRSVSTVKRRLAQVGAVFVALVGLVTLSQHVFGWNVGLDQWLFHESKQEAGQSLRIPEIDQSPRLAKMGEALRRNAQSQSQLINDLLDLSRLQRGKISLNHEPVSLPAIIDNAVETVRADATAKGINIQLNVSEQLLLVDGDRLRLQQVAWNILNNAVKFTPTGGKIEIGLSSENGNAVLAVKDTGQGIDPSFLPHVFEMFRQADGSNRRRHGGLGIGLALVRQLVQLHGGTIDAESEGPNKGSCFKVELPLIRETTPLASSVSASTGAVELNLLSRTNFLIVDDSEDTIAMLEELLKLSGANVTSATNGADALRLARENEFDVILSDISMPEMDGFEFLQRLREIDGRQHVPVIAITGFGRTGDIERARAAGFYSHLTKPLNLQALAEVLQQLAGGSGHSEPNVDQDLSAGPVC